MGVGKGLRGDEPFKSDCKTSDGRVVEVNTVEYVCPGFEGCKAPVCPVDDSFREAIWFAEEDYCQARKYRREHWRKIQKKIAKVNCLVPVNGYFNLRRLEGIRRVVRGIEGLSQR